MGLHKKVDGDGLDGRYLSVSPLLDGKVTVPKHRLPDGPMLPEMAYELMLDGNARLNLATFVTRWMEPQAEKLMAEAFDKNMIDKDEYPQTAELEMRCVNMLSRLWNSPSTDQATGKAIFPDARRILDGLRPLRKGTATRTIHRIQKYKEDST
jgi:glutamate decarboxylase